MTTSNLYRRYIQACSKFKIDETKKGRDYAIHLRQQITKIFPQGELTSLQDQAKVQKEIEALERLAANHYYKPTFENKASATRLTAEECKACSATDFKEQLDQINSLPFISRLRMGFGFKYALLMQGSK